MSSIRFSLRRRREIPFSIVPYRLGARNLDTLRQQLGALDRPRLLKIIAAFNLNPAGKNITAFSDDQLVTFILKAVRAQLAQRAR